MQLSVSCGDHIVLGSFTIILLFSCSKTGRGKKGDGRGIDGSNVKLYLQPPLLELRVAEPELLFLTDLPGGLDTNEWMASHSEFMIDRMHQYSIVRG